MVNDPSMLEPLKFYCLFFDCIFFYYSPLSDNVSYLIVKTVSGFLFTKKQKEHLFRLFYSNVSAELLSGVTQREM